MENGVALFTKETYQKNFSGLGVRTGINREFKPRWYQTEAVNSIFNFFIASNGAGHPLVVCPTGAGKSHILGMFCKQVLDAWPDQRILILTHVDTIIKQDYHAICEHIPDNKVGIFSSGVGRKQRRAVTIAGIQSIHKKAIYFKGTDIILIDEAHTVPVRGEGMYRSFLAQFNVPIVGLTATHFRLGSGYLHQGDGRIFTDIAYEIDMERLIEDGHLCNLLPKDPLEHIDVKGVRTQGGDFVKKELVERATRSGLTTAIIKDLETYKEKYKRWLIFAIDIKHAEDITQRLNDVGVRSAVVHSQQSKQINEETKQLYKAGVYQALISVETLTTGFDDPAIDLIVLMRPTKSPVLHIQMIGRGLRVHPDKDHCRVLDYAGNIHRLGPINSVHIETKKKKGKGPGITKTCPQCRTICAGATRICPTCGFKFVFKEKLKENATDKRIIARSTDKQFTDNWYPVDKVSYAEYVGKYGLSLLVSYRSGIRTFFEYKVFDPSRRSAYNHAKHWWTVRSGGTNIPTTTIDAVIVAKNGALIEPEQLLIREGLKYPQIIRAKF